MTIIDLGARLKSLRKARDMSQSELAKYLEVHESTVSLYESGKNEPSMDKIAKLALLFGVSCDYLIFGYDNANYRDEIEKRWPGLAQKLIQVDEKLSKKKKYAITKLIEAIAEDGEEYGHD